MIIDLTRLTKPEISFSFVSQPDLEDESARVAETVKTVGKLRTGIARVDVAGNISGEVEIECARCLVETNVHLDFPFAAVFVTEEYYTTEREIELRGQDLDVSIYDGERIDLSDLAREQILLNLPIQTLCKAECKGLCPKCGANLNRVNCDCREEEIDPRWAALKNLK